MRRNQSGHVRDVTSDLVEEGVCCTVDDQGMVRRPTFHLEDSTHATRRIDRCSEAIDGLGGKGDDPTISKDFRRAMKRAGVLVGNDSLTHGSSIGWS